MTASDWVQLAILALTALSLVFHRAHNAKLNELGNDVDIVKGLLPASKDGGK